MRIKKLLFLLLFLLIGGLAYFLFRPLAVTPSPATFSCLDIKEGEFISRDSLPSPSNIYGMGLTYSKHLEETATEFDPDAIPPIFKKKLQSICENGAKVQLPTKEEMITAADGLEPGIGTQIREKYESLSPMLDYEVELGFVLLESISPEDLKKESFIPKLGFFIGNDLSARSLALLGEGTDIRYEYWGISKSFPNFLPISENIWVPNTPASNTIPCLKIETYVNGQERQSQSTDNMIYTPLEMIRFIHQKYPEVPLLKGDMVLTGTPGGVAVATPRALVRLSNLLGIDRFKKLGIKLGGDLSPFLKVGDQVEIRGEELGNVNVEITETR